MANIHLIGGEKGGVGKSVVARVLAQRQRVKVWLQHAYEQIDRVGI